MRLLLVLAGGAIGSGTRYLTATWLAARFGTGFPWGTLVVNVVGCFLIGLIATLSDERGSVGANVRVFLVVGFLGGLTTFSSFALETMRLVQNNTPARALFNLFGSLMLGFAAAIVGISAGRNLGPPPAKQQGGASTGVVLDPYA